MQVVCSVIIPVYNREKLLKRAIESVTRQTFSNWELLVVDDCSTDNSSAVASSFGDDRIRVLSTPENSGAAAARNVGIRHAKGIYIALLDSDDVYHQDFLQYSLQRLQNTGDDYGFSYTGVGNINEFDNRQLTDCPVWELPERFKKFKHPYLYQLQLGTAAGIIIKKGVFDRVGLFDESLQAAEDTDWFIRASEYYKGLPMAKYLIFKDNDSQGRLTTNYRKNADAYRVIIRKNEAEIHGSIFLMRRWYYKSMWLNFYSSDRKSAAADYQTLRKNKVSDFKIKLTYLAGLFLSRNLFIIAHKQLSKLR